MSEPLMTTKANKTGRPVISEDQYRDWYIELKPFLEVGNSLNRAIDKAGLYPHRTTIYDKFRLKDWFSYKIISSQSRMGELLNETFAQLVESAHKKSESNQPLNRSEIKMLSFIALHHKSASPFFNNGLKFQNVDSLVLTDHKEPPHPTIQYVSQAQIYEKAKE